MFKKTQVHYIEDWYVNNNGQEKGHTAVGWNTLIGSGWLHRRGPNNKPVDEDLIIKLRPGQPTVYPIKSSISVRTVSKESPISQRTPIVATLFIGSYNEMVHDGFSARLSIYENDHPRSIVKEFERRCEITLDAPTKRVLVKKIEKRLSYHKLRQH